MVVRLSRIQKWILGLGGVYMLVASDDIGHVAAIGCFFILSMNEGPEQSEPGTGSEGEAEGPEYII